MLPLIRIDRHITKKKEIAFRLCVHVAFISGRRNIGSTGTLAPELLLQNQRIHVLI